MSSSTIFIHENLHLYILDLFTATRHHQLIEGTLLSAQSVADCFHAVRAWRLLFGAHAKSTQEERNQMITPSELDATDEDVRSVFPRVVSHRLKVRESPRDELLASAVFCATDASDEGYYTQNERRTVKEVVTEIMNSV